MVTLIGIGFFVIMNVSFDVKMVLKRLHCLGKQPFNVCEYVKQAGVCLIGI